MRERENCEDCFRNAKGNPRIQTKHPQATALVQSRETSEAAWEPVVLTFTVKVPVLPLLNVRDGGVAEHVACTGTCAQANVTIPLEPVAETIESE
jgi:hypothetical protein